MKKFICVIIGCIIPLFLLADIVPTSSHLVKNSVQFTNLDNFSEIAILGYIIGPSYDSPNFFLIKNNEVLQKGYKFNDLGLYWSQKKYVDSVGIENIVIKTDIGPEYYRYEYFEKVTNDPNIFFITSVIDPGDFWADDSNPLMEQSTDYKIAGFIGNEIVVYRARQVQKSKNADDVIDEYELPLIPNLNFEPFADSSSSSESQKK